MEMEDEFSKKQVGAGQSGKGASKKSKKKKGPAAKPKQLASTQLPSDEPAEEAEEEEEEAAQEEPATAAGAIMINYDALGMDLEEEEEEHQQGGDTWGSTGQDGWEDGRWGPGQEGGAEWQSPAKAPPRDRQPQEGGRRFGSGGGRGGERGGVGAAGRGRGGGRAHEDKQQQEQYGTSTKHEQQQPGARGRGRAEEGDWDTGSSSSGRFGRGGEGQGRGRSSSTSMENRAPGGAAADSVARRTLVCVKCGLEGHTESACDTPFCETCRLYGHSRLQHNTSCWTCGQTRCLKMYKQGAGGGCSTPCCSNCNMFGHSADVCPKPAAAGAKGQQGAGGAGVGGAAGRGGGRQRLNDADRDDLFMKIFKKWPDYATELLEDPEKAEALYTMSKQRIDSLISSPNLGVLKEQVRLAQERVQRQKEQEAAAPEKAQPPPPATAAAAGGVPPPPPPQQRPSRGEGPLAAAAAATVRAAAAAAAASSAAGSGTERRRSHDSDKPAEGAAGVGGEGQAPARAARNGSAAAGAGAGGSGMVSLGKPREGRALKPGAGGNKGQQQDEGAKAAGRKPSQQQGGEGQEDASIVDASVKAVHAIAQVSFRAQAAAAAGVDSKGEEVEPATGKGNEEQGALERAAPGSGPLGLPFIQGALPPALAGGYPAGSMPMALPPGAAGLPPALAGQLPGALAHMLPGGPPMAPPMSMPPHLAGAAGMGMMPLVPGGLPSRLTEELFAKVLHAIPLGRPREAVQQRFVEKSCVSLEMRSAELLQFLEESREEAGPNFPQAAFDELNQALQEHLQQQQMPQHMGPPHPGMYNPSGPPFMPQMPPAGAAWPPHAAGMPPPAGMLPHMMAPAFHTGFNQGAEVAGGYPPYPHPHMQQQYPPQSQQLPQQQQVVDEEGSDGDSEDMLNALLGGNDAAGAQPEAEAADADGQKGWGRVAGGDTDQQMDDASFPRLGATAAAEEGEDEEGGDDRDLQRALQASLETANERPARGAISSTGGGEVAARVVGGLEVGAAGLANETGEYNCFLNVVVQCLWNCKTFRTMLVNACKDTEQPVVKSLVDLFQDLQEAQAGWQPGQAR